MRYDDRGYGSPGDNGLKTFGRWLGRRPIESWGFFAAGFLIARILF
jgi:hypothetical protein